MKTLALCVAIAMAASVRVATAQPAGSNGDTNPPGSSGLGGTTATQQAQAIAQANALTAVYNAQAAQANAQKAAIDAKTDAAKATVGTIPGQTATGGGATTVPAGAANGEGTLLVVRASDAAAETIAAAIHDKINAASTRVLLITDLAQLSPADAMQFDLQISMVGFQLAAANKACVDAMKLSDKTGVAQGASRFFAPAVGVAIDSAAKLLSYFQTDYSFGSIQVSEPSNLVVGTMAAALLRSGVSNVVVPANLTLADAQPLINAISPLRSDYVQIVGCDPVLKTLSAAAKANHPATGAALDQADAQATKAMAAYEAFMTALTAAPSGGGDPVVVRVVRGKRLQMLLNDPHSVALVIVEQQVAEYYTKKNLWTFLGGPPLYTMGGVAAVYTLFDPSTGVVLAAGAVPKHGGYRSVSQVQKLFQ